MANYDHLRRKQDGGGVWHLTRNVSAAALAKCALNFCDCVTAAGAISTFPALTLTVGGTTTARPWTLGPGCAAPSSCPSHSASADLDCGDSVTVYAKETNRLLVCAYGSAPIISVYYWISLVLRYKGASPQYLQFEVETGYATDPSGPTPATYTTVQRFLDRIDFLALSEPDRCLVDPLPALQRTWIFGEGAVENCCSIDNITTSIALV